GSRMRDEGFSTTNSGRVERAHDAARSAKAPASQDVFESGTVGFRRTACEAARGHRLRLLSHRHSRESPRGSARTQDRGQYAFGRPQTGHRGMVAGYAAAEHTRTAILFKIHAIVF